ncbi:hypothetical protein [Falsibacillus albus]|uniref:Uncharacterized protein n=1 Tax=Falsibacillus albus TaxID=2478915 RepID=A0A3L7K3F6_9BACI|nr:hypothetical protein [Falsibacillus albus]RLQ97360.1 hypothetical protein D9X91_04205 [Falsibacillus albus]
MIIAIQIILFFLLLFVCVYSKYKLPFKEFIFVFLVSSILLMNSYTVMSLNLKWIAVSDHYEKFIGFLLFRNLCMPLMFTAVLAIISKAGKSGKGLAVVFYFIAIIGMESINLSFSVYHYLKWNLLMTLLFYILFLAVMNFLLKGFKALERIKHHESV